MAAADGLTTGNTLRSNRHAGVALRGQTRGFRVESNRFAANNSNLRLSAKASRQARAHVNVAQDAQSNAVGSNQYE